jgi:transposase-like protein
MKKLKKREKFRFKNPDRLVEISDKGDQRLVETAEVPKREVIRCPCCKSVNPFDKYLFSRAVGSLCCPNCGVLFLDKSKLKIVKENAKKAPEGPRIIMPNDREKAILGGRK